MPTVPAPTQTTGTAVDRDIADLRKSIAESGERLSKARKDAEMLKRAIGAADKMDADAYAAARRAGKEPTGPLESDKVKEALADAQRRIRGEEVLLRQLHAEVDHMRQDQQVPWLADLRKVRAARLASAREALIASASALQDVKELDALATWVVIGKSVSQWPETAIVRGEGKRNADISVAVRAAVEAASEWATAPWMDALEVPHVEDEEEVSE